MNAKDKARDKYLQRTYGITLADRRYRLDKQGGCCAICGRPEKPDGPVLHVDHDHKWKRIKITVKKFGPDMWEATSRYRDIPTSYLSPRRAEAVKMLKQYMLRSSVRGLLCWKCNTGLQKWRDNPILMEKAADYLRRHCPPKPQ